MYPQKLIIANFVCTFGSKHVMLDMYDQVVGPAFLSKFSREYSDSTYFFLDTTLVKIGAELYLSGRLIKDTVVRRDQYYDQGKLIHDPQQIESSPSSFFSLQLSNHKLFYVRENSNAPSLKAFESSAQSFLNQSHKKWITAQYRQINEKSRKITWGKIIELYPYPWLELTPIATEQSVSAFVEKFRTVNTVEIKLLDTNHELDNSPIFGDMREVKSKIGATDISLKTHKSGESGLDKGGVAQLVASQAGDGNSRISIVGKSLDGDPLRAQNENFKISLPIKNLPQEILRATSQVVDKIKTQMDLGVIALTTGPTNAFTKVGQIIARITWQ